MVFTRSRGSLLSWSSVSSAEGYCRSGPVGPLDRVYTLPMRYPIYPKTLMKMGERIANTKWAPFELESSDQYRFAPCIIMGRHVVESSAKNWIFNIRILAQRRATLPKKTMRAGA
jgi:hypothetical protein